MVWLHAGQFCQTTRRVNRGPRKQIVLFPRGRGGLHQTYVSPCRLSAIGPTLLTFSVLSALYGDPNNPAPVSAGRRLGLRPS